MYKLKGKKVLVVGLGKTGESAARYLVNQGAKVTATDQKTKGELAEAVKTLEPMGVTMELGKFNKQSFTSAELIVLSPGVPRTLPEMQEAIAAGIQVINDIDLAAEHFNAPVIAVTGTNGKTTVTTMISEMLKTDGKNVFTCGNIGTPVLDLVNNGLTPDVIVMEISSYQAETFTNFKPNVAVLTNLEPDHGDRYPTGPESYFAAKKRLIQNMDAESTLVLNLENSASLKWAEGFPGRVLYFSKKDPMTIGGAIAESFQGTYLKRPRLISKVGSEATFELMGSRLPGDHNRENWMAAINAARTVGCGNQAIQKVIQEFRGVAHRLEFIRRKDGVTFYNDSKATNVASVQRSLASFMAPIILIAGGRDKDQEFAPLIEPVKQKVKNLILVGEAKEKINRALGDFSETFLVGTFEEAVLLAYQKSRNGDIILFSPACASFDMFKNFEERGDYFKKLVLQL